MNPLKRNLVIFLLLGIYSFFTLGYAQSYDTEIVVGYVYGEVDAGETYELYKSSSDSFREYLAGWKAMGWRDKRVDYSYEEIHEKCLNEAKRKYGKDYPNLYLKDFTYHIEKVEEPDEEYFSQVSGSTTQYRKKERERKVYIYSATVMANQ